MKLSSQSWKLIGNATTCSDGTNNSWPVSKTSKSPGFCLTESSWALVHFFKKILEEESIMKAGKNKQKTKLKLKINYEAEKTTGKLKTVRINQIKI